MKPIKFIAVAIIAVAVVAFSASVFAEGVSYNAITISSNNTAGSSLTNVIGPGVVVTNPITIGVMDFNEVGLHVKSYKGLNDGSNVTIGIRRSWDNAVTFETAAYVSWIMPTQANLNTNSVGTNLTVGSVSHIQLYTISNGSTNGGAGTLNLYDVGYILKNRHN